MKKEIRNSIPVYSFGSVDSTNRVAMDMAENTGDRFAVVRAEEQTAGKGRLGRSFFSPGGGLYMSLIFSLEDVEFIGEEAGCITTAAAVSVSRAVERTTGIVTQIKWINDVLLNGRKICGILTEGRSDGHRLTHVVIGVGVNAGKCDFPDDISGTAGYIDTDRDELSDEILSELTYLLSGLFSERKEHFREDIISYAREHSSLLGREIRIFRNHRSGESVRATAVDIDSRTSGLTVRYDDGTMETITSGEVTVRREG